jgi:hypothetical protein
MLLAVSNTAALAQAPSSQPTTGSENEEVEKLRKRIDALERKLGSVTDKVEETELEKIVREAEAEAKAPEEQDKPEQREFLWGALALQKLNPEISFCGDFVAQLVLDGDKYYAGRDDRSGMPIREISLQFQHVLDPYSRFKAAINFIPWPDVEVEPEEVYITWFGLVRSLSLTVGRFRHDFGIINRWHGHDLDQVDYPLALTLTLGEGGLAGNGFAVKWFLPPLWAHANELTMAVTDGESETLFAGEHFSVPVGLVHLKSYYDLTESTYLELGLSGAFGVNNRRGYVPPGHDEIQDEDWRRTVALGADLTLHWQPPRQAKYRSLTWRTEYYFVDKQTPDDPDDGERQSWGLYSYIDYQLGTRWFAGVRGDAALPTIRGQYNDDKIAWDVVPYVTFWQSEFVYLRLEYRHGRNIPHVLQSGGAGGGTENKQDGALARRTDNRVLFQVDFAAGPHKHEKY